MIRRHTECDYTSSFFNCDKISVKISIENSLHVPWKILFLDTRNIDTAKILYTARILSILWIWELEYSFLSIRVSVFQMLKQNLCSLGQWVYLHWLKLLVVNKSLCSFAFVFHPRECIWHQMKFFTLYVALYTGGCILPREERMTSGFETKRPLTFFLSVFNMIR